MQSAISLLDSFLAVRKRAAALLAVGFASAAVAVLYFADPLEQLAWLRCPVNLTTGLYCPGCGSLRAVHALLHGDIVAALHSNLLAVVFLPVLVGFGIRSFVYAMKDRSPAIGTPPFVAWSVFWIVILFTVLRNLPFELTRALRP